MGVKGLLTYILNSGDLRRVRLSVLADNFQRETGKRPKLLLDFFEIGRKFWSSPITVLKEVGDYPEYASICGPDFHLVADRARCFVKALRSIGIEPVFFVDVPFDHDSDDDRVLQKLKSGRAKVLANNYLIQQVLEHNKVQSLPSNRCNDLVNRQMLYSLKEEGAEMVFCTQRSCPVIARYAQTHEETCGVVSDNPDFAIINGCVLFLLEEFDCENLTGLKKGVSVDKEPGEIIAMAITSVTLARSLDIQEDQLPDLAVLCGTSHTKRYIHKLSVLTALGVEGSEVEDVAAWLKGKDTPLMANDVMKELCLLHPELRVAIEQSYSSFAPQEPSALSHASPEYELIEREMLKPCDLAFASAKRGNVWLNIPCENLNLGQPSIMDLLRPIRKTVYILLGVSEVREYGRTMTQACEMRTVPVCASQEEVTACIERLHSLRAVDRCSRLVAAYRLTAALSVQCVREVTEIVDGVLKSSLSFPNIEWPKMHKLALLCCSLKLMALLNKLSLPSLDMSDEEFGALLLSSLTCATEGAILPHIVHVLPSMKAVAISEWFCVALDILYEVVGVLGVTNASPEPRNIFYPMAFIPYHLALQPHPNLTARQEVDIESVKTAMQTALSLPAVMEFRSCVFNTDKLQPLPELIVLCNAALDEVLENAEQLLPRTMTATLEELCGLQVQENDKKDEVSPDEEQEAGSSASSRLEAEDEKVEPPLVWGKEELPIMEHKETILELIAGHQVVCIEGETGCGKSSQVPQFILKQFENSKILVSQPNYLAAKKLAERVSVELLVPPDTLVTYCDELHTGNGRLIYGTNGFTLQMLLENQEVCSYTHIILDEIHERTTDIDFAMLLLRQLATKLPELKIILMSATLQGKLFVEYFRQTLGNTQVADPYFVGIRRFPVHVFFIDELSELISKKDDAMQDNAMRELIHLQSRLQSDSSILAHSAEVSSYAQEVCINLIISQPDPGDSILVFLPGLGDMIELHTALVRRLRKLNIRQRFQIFIFHNQIPYEEEKEAFEKPRDGQANVIISHTIAESSITFPHLKMVINFGIRRYMIYDPQKHISTLTRQWCSKASCIQREGRVGRISEGTAIHLFMKQDHEKLADFNLPEIVSAPLSKTVLRAKQIIRKGCGFSLPSLLLSSLVEPPSLLQFEAALHDLVEIGAILHNPHESHISEEAEITLLGEFSLGLPLDLKLCRLILLGILFGCPLDAVVIAAGLSMYQDIFTLPTRIVMDNMRKYCESLTRSTFSRLKCDAGSYSKAIMVRNMYLQWLQFLHSESAVRKDRREMANQFGRKCSIRVTRLLHFDTSVADIARAAAKWLPLGSETYAELVALSHVERGRVPPPTLCSNTYFTEESLEPSPAPATLAYIPLHLRNMAFQRSHGTRHQLHFCNDNVLLKTLITAASPNEIMYGERCCDSSVPDVRAYARRCVKIAMEEGFYPSDTLSMNLSSISSLDIDLWSERLQESNEATIRELYDSLPRGFHFPVNVKVDKETETAVLNFYSAEATSNVVKIARDMGYAFGKNHVDHSTAELSKLSPELHVLWRLGECRSMWEVDGVNALFPYVGHPCKLGWHMLDKDKHRVNSVHLNFRNPTGLMCLFKEPQYPYLAVSTRSFLSDVGVIMATQVTLLPPPPQSLMIILAFQLPTSVTELLIDRRERKVKGLRLNHNEIPCENIDQYISAERLGAINQLRLSLSNALSSSLHNKQILLGELRLKELQENLAKILNSSAEPDTASHSPSSFKAQETATGVLGTYAESLVWEMITPGKLLEAGDLPGQFYYPDLKCSLLGSEPYAVMPARCDQTTLSTTPSPVQYKETISTKLLLENFERVDSDSDEEQFVGGSGEPTPEGCWIVEQKSASKKLLKAKKSASRVPSDNSEVVAEKNGAMRAQGESAIAGPNVSKRSLNQKGAAPPSSLSFAEQVVAKLEQEIVRHLQRNNKVEFLSELRIQRRIKHICALVKITLNVPFFLQRPNLFQVREVEDGEEGPDAAVVGQEYLIVLDQSKWRDVESDEEDPVLPPSMRIVKESRRAAVNKKPSLNSNPAKKGATVSVTEGTQTEGISFSSGSKSRIDPAANKLASREVVKSSPSKPLTATKAVKLSEAKVSTPHISVVVEDKKKVEVAKKPEPVVSKPASTARSSAHPETVDQAKSLSKEPAKKTATSASKKKGPMPGTDEHLALYLLDYVKKHGGEVRLGALRKEAFPEYYDRYPNLRYGGYRYLRKMFLLDYPQYFEVFGDKKILYVRTVEEKEVVASHQPESKSSSSSKLPTQDMKQEKTTTKQGQGKEGPNSSKKVAPITGNQESAQHSEKASSTSEPHVHVREMKDEPNHAGTDKTDKHLHVHATEMTAKPPSQDVVQGSKPDTVQFVQVPSSSRLSQEPIAVSELDADQLSISTTITQSTPPHSLSQLRSQTHTTDQQVITKLLSLGTTSDARPAPQQLTSDQMVHVRTLESAPPEAASLGKPVGATTQPLTAPIPLAAPSLTFPSAVQHPVQSQVKEVMSVAGSQPQHPTGVTGGVAFSHPSVGAEGMPTCAVPHPTTVAHPPRSTGVHSKPHSIQNEENEEEWHSSEESWLSEEEFEAAQGSREHIAEYLHNYLSTHSFPFGCTVLELDRVYQNDYKRRFRSKKVANITAELLRSHPQLFKLRDETFLKLREGVDHMESNTFRGRPYTPEHINDYYSRYLGKEGVVCSLSEAQHVFETSYRKEFKMPVNPLIWFVGDSFFRRSYHQFVVFNDSIVFKTEEKY